MPVAMVVVMLGWAVEFPPGAGSVLFSEATWWEAEEQRNRILIAIDAAEPGETQINPTGGAHANRALQNRTEA